MVKKIFLIISWILLFLGGGITFWLQKRPLLFSKRDYIVISVQGEINYLFPLALAPNLTVWQIISYFDLKQSANLNQIYLQTKKAWTKINLFTNINEDSVFKINA